MDTAAPRWTPTCLVELCPAEDLHKHIPKEEQRSNGNHMIRDDHPELDHHHRMMA